jgi:ArsR family transcriptional regulator
MLDRNHQFHQSALDKRKYLWYHIDVLKFIYLLEANVDINCVEFCKTLADDTRQQILVMLLEREMSVGDIVDAFSMSQPTISHHLGILKQFGLVVSRKEGKQVFYAINRDNVVTCCGQLIAKFDAQEACEI